jgi:hypothetical protein
MPRQIFEWGLFFPKKFFEPYSLRKEIQKIFPTMISKNKSHKIFPHPCLLKRGPNFTISLIPAFGSHPLQIFWPSITEARANLPNVLAKILWSFLPPPPSLDTRQLHHCQFLLFYLSLRANKFAFWKMGFRQRRRNIDNCGGRYSYIRVHRL